jgi:hypothetical protein
MGAGLIQLMAYGSQDIYLTGNPQITFFKIVYRRHTNFSMEIAEQSISGTPSKGGVSDIKISRIGDLLTKIYITSTSNTNDITNGSAILSRADLEIGGQLIDRQTVEWMNIYNELTIPRSKSLAFKYMIGDHGTSGTGTTSGVRMIQVPLNFWFCKSPGLALPLIALQYHEINLKINWGSPSWNMVENAKVYCDYIYLDVDERKRFAQVSHEYLIEQVQSQSMVGSGKERLNFNHPVKEIIWTSPNNHHIIGYHTAQLRFNGMPRTPFMESEYYQLRQPFDHHTEVPEQNTHVGFHFTSEYIHQTTQNLSSLATSVKVGATITSSTIGSGNCIVALSPSTEPLGNSLPITAAAAFTAETITGAAVDRVALIMGNTDATSAGFVAGNIGLNFRIRIFGADAVSGGSNYGTTLGLGDTPYTLKGVQVGRHSGSDAGCVNDTVTVVSFNQTIFDNEARNLAVGTADFAGVTDGFKINSIEFRSTVLHGVSAVTSKMEERINVYSFALKPEEHQPSGTCNFSRLDNIELEFSGGSNPDSTHNIYAVNYNILRIMSGMGGLAYNN